MEAIELAVAVVAAPASAGVLEGSSEGTLAPATCIVLQHQVEPSEDGLQGSVAGYQQLQPNTGDSSEAGLDT